MDNVRELHAKWMWYMIISIIISLIYVLLWCPLIQLNVCEYNASSYICDNLLFCLLKVFCCAYMSYCLSWEWMFRRSSGTDSKISSLWLHYQLFYMNPCYNVFSVENVKNHALSVATGNPLPQLTVHGQLHWIIVRGHVINLIVRQHHLDFLGIDW